MVVLNLPSQRLFTAVFWRTYLDDSVVCTPQFKAMLVRIRPAALKQQRAVRVWQIAIRTWEKHNIPHAVRWWSSKVFGILGVDPGVVSWVGKRRDEILQAREKNLENLSSRLFQFRPCNWLPLDRLRGWVFCGSFTMSGWCKWTQNTRRTSSFTCVYWMPL